MRKTFEQFGYDIHPLQGGTATDVMIKGLLGQVCQSLGKYSVIVFAFSGHGTDYDQLLTNNGKWMSLKEEIILPILKNSSIDIPKVFFIDACRGSEILKSKGGDKSGDDVPESVEHYEKGFTRSQANYRIDYATIPDHKAFTADYGSKWMPVLARKLRKTDDTLQNIAPTVTGEVFKIDQRQQSESVDRLHGPLKLHIRK